MQPVKYQKIHWTASEGVNNKGAIRFRKGEKKNTCTVALTIAYEVPQVLEPVGEALKPLVENILQAGTVPTFPRQCSSCALRLQPSEFCDTHYFHKSHLPGEVLFMY